MARAETHQVPGLVVHGVQLDGVLPALERALEFLVGVLLLSVRERLLRPAHVVVGIAVGALRLLARRRTLLLGRRRRRDGGAASTATSSSERGEHGRGGEDGDGQKGEDGSR